MRRELAAGTVLAGRYRIEGEIGAGGAGITYRAVDSATASVVVIKEHFPAVGATRDPGSTAVVPTGDVEAYWTSLRRAQTEEAALRALDVPGVVRIRDAFESNGTAYVVMDHVDGETLEQVIQRGVQPDDARRILQWLCWALGGVHRQGFVHQDLTPRNVIVQPDGTPTLIDFGLARTAGGDRTHHGGTLAYAAPEQVLPGSTSPVSPRSDVWALGLVAAQLLVGPLNASDFDVSQLRGRVAPQEFEAIRRAREVDADLRPADATEFATVCFASSPPPADPGVAAGGLTGLIGAVPRPGDPAPGSSSPPVAAAPEGGLTGMIGPVARPAATQRGIPEAADGAEPSGSNGATVGGRRRRLVVAVIVGLLVLGAAGATMANGLRSAPSGGRAVALEDATATSAPPTTEVLPTEPPTTASSPTDPPSAVEPSDSLDGSVVPPPDLSRTAESRAQAERVLFDKLRLGMTPAQVHQVLGTDPTVEGELETGQGIAGDCTFWDDRLSDEYYRPGQDSGSWSCRSWELESGLTQLDVSFRNGQAVEITWSVDWGCEEGIRCESRTFSVLGNDSPID